MGNTGFGILRHGCIVCSVAVSALLVVLATPSTRGQSLPRANEWDSLGKETDGVDSQAAHIRTADSRNLIDCDGNGVPDLCDVTEPPGCTAFGCDPETCGLVPDCNNNVVPDDCEPDCDLNTVPDQCDIRDCWKCAGGPHDASVCRDDDDCAPGVCELTDPACGDCQPNTVPDGCEEDCDHDGVPDDCEATLDADGDGFEDCEDQCPFTTPTDACFPSEVLCRFNSGFCATVTWHSCILTGGTPVCGGPPQLQCQFGTPCPAPCPVGCFGGVCCDSPNGPCVDGEPDGDGDRIGDRCDECPDHPPGVTCGACCDYPMEACSSEVSEADCATLQPDPMQRAWFGGERCADDGGTITCPESTGACCDTLGACEILPESECNCPTCVFHLDMPCGEIECVNNPIPTVSEWELVVLTLLLLTGAKIHFARCETGRAR